MIGEDEATHIYVNILYTEASLCLQTKEVDVAHLMRRMSQTPNPAKRAYCCWCPSSKDDGWLATRARTDQAHVSVYSLHILQKRVQTVPGLAKQGVVPSIEDLETIRDAMLQHWHDAHRLTPLGVPLSYEELHGRPERRG